MSFVSFAPLCGGFRIYARNHYAAVHGLQRKKLLNDQEQEEEHRTDGNQEILSALPASHRSS
jgi:hypothetical protein